MAPMEQDCVGLLVIVAVNVAVKFTESIALDVKYAMEVSGWWYSPDRVLCAEKWLLGALEYEVYCGCSPWYWMRYGNGPRTSGAEQEASHLEDLLVQVMLLDYRFIGERPSVQALVAIYTAGMILGVEKEEIKRRCQRLGCDVDTDVDEKLGRGCELVMKIVGEEEFGGLRLGQIYMEETMCMVSRRASEWARGKCFV
ncbi:hypothetical protein AMATHDRAFT_70261 [Amanita thiersii Skay4041]|uniref:Cyclin C-terminal domain-containing protein n=1 Tax=Amanita thiersii Skay4041 TaxID=703135 RepID=A0A2A9N7B5_9AGAR|nr:hypothetical protein AMATHDRAFT_70261 [Amanita thiersii Skay4041]